MRLLNACSWELRDFISEKNTPPYAILSHTWGDEEVSFRDWETQPATLVETKEGFVKIEYCCAQAISDGYEWVWIDTCCIDKSSSAELSEAINSMFKWYRNAEICYAYLSDTLEVSTPVAIRFALSNCRWISRGWTLQELLAPREVIFYTKYWRPIGSRTELHSHLAEVTGIGRQYIKGCNLNEASIAQRMSWVARRNTSREEDMAYCLLGIFDVNMPLLYGEGMKAFRRLQEILAHEYYKDHTLYAWGELVSSLPGEIVYDDVREWKPPKHGPRRPDRRSYGLLAESPKDFQYSGNIISSPGAEAIFTGFLRNEDRCSPPTFIGQSAQINLPCSKLFSYAEFSMTDPPITQLKNINHIYLLCGRWDSANEKFLYAVIPICRTNSGHCTRLYELLIDEIYAFWPDTSSASLSPLVGQLTVEPLIPTALQNGDILFRKRVLKAWESSYLATTEINIFLLTNCIRLLRPTYGIIECFVCRLNETVCVAFCYQRPQNLTSSRAKLTIGLSIFIESETPGTDLVHIRSTKRSRGTTLEEVPATPTFPTLDHAVNYYFGNRENFSYLEEMALPYDEWKFEIIDAENESIASVEIGTERLFYDFGGNGEDSAGADSEGYVDCIDRSIWSYWDGNDQSKGD
ncbi:heterokaryon incompatibility protein-domain-containing protein [Xylariaceae sp. FL0255]|nr:heterokaryon incompatibility protein-domain-containing protein [Xylariaceae sp. FL0255]